MYKGNVLVCDKISSHDRLAMHESVCVDRMDSKPGLASRATSSAASRKQPKQNGFSTPAICVYPDSVSNESFVFERPKQPIESTLRLLWTKVIMP